jgi:hypothetical protein
MWERKISMKYKVLVFNNDNKEEWTFDEVYETKEATEAAIGSLKANISQDYQYVKVPVKQ